MELEIELPVYDGPLDLLLGLIEKNKINIFDIPIVEITDQYLEYVRNMKEEDLGLMSEFMVMAAELISIKCRMLLPKEENEEEEDEGDPREALVRRLLEYKTYKYMSYELRDKMDEASLLVTKPETIPKEVKQYKPPVDTKELIGDLTMARLHEIFRDVLKRQENRTDPVRSTFGTIEKEPVSLPDKLESVAKYAKRHRHFSFRQLLEKKKSRSEIVVTFLAILELMKYGAIRAEQKDADDDIEIEAAENMDLDAIKHQYEEDGDMENGET